MIRTIADVLSTIWEGLWPIIKWLAEVLLKILILYTIVAAFFLEHELIHKLVPGVRRTRLGRIIIFLGNSFKKFLVLFGFSFYRPTFVEEWAGRYEPEESHGVVKTAVNQSARNLHAMLTSRTFGNHRIYLKGPEGCGTRQIAQEVLRILSAERREVFYFDCSAVTRADLHARFIHNIGAWASAAEIVSASEPEPSYRHGIQDIVNAGNIRSFLRNYKKRGAKRPIVIILDVERLLESNSEETQVRTEEILRILVSSRHSTALITGSSIDLEQAFRTTQNPVVRFIRRKIPNKLEEYSGVKRSTLDYIINKEFSQNSVSPHPEDPIKLDELHVLLALLDRSPQEDRSQIIRQFYNWQADKLPEELIHSVADRIIKTGIWNRTSSQERVENGTNHKNQVIWLLAVLSLFDAPVPVTAITQLWTACKLAFNFPLTSVQQAIARDEPLILEELVTYGLVQRRCRSSQLYLHAVYVVRPGFKNICYEYLENDEPLKQRAEEVAKAILSGLRPPGITPVSKYISHSDFGTTRGLLGYLRQTTGGPELIIPLPSDVCDLISAIPLQPILPELRTYTWSDRGGAKHADLVATLSPIDFSLADRVCRVGVHIVSREGTGRAVQNALQPFVDAFLDVEGDANRFGPGGYLELLVQLKPAEEIKNEERILHAVKTAHDRDIYEFATLEVLLRYIENEIEKTLRANIDDKATVQLVLGANESVAQDWKDHAKLFSYRIALERATESIYGSTSRYSLIVPPAAYEAILRHLRSETGKTHVTAVVVQCVYSYATLQAFFVFKALSLQERVRARVVGAQDSVQPLVPLSFMEVFEQKKLSLETLKHGPDGSYIADFELPLAPFGVQQQEYNSALLRAIMDDLAEKNVNISFIHSPRLIGQGLEREEKSNVFTQKQFAGGPLIVADNFEYVADPHIFHRYMRKHLFIPDSDAAIVAIAKTFLSGLDKEAYRVLEIGSGTGALTAKLIQADIRGIDTLEPDKVLSDYWEQLRKDLDLNQGGQHCCSSLEAFIKTSPQKYDLIVSQGVHHHIPTSMISELGTDLNYRLTFLELCRSILNPDGIYIASDEFLVDYQDDEQVRIANLDQWYRCVISTALADGYSELADLEYRFWLNDRDQTIEYKESIEVFESRLRTAGQGAPFDVTSVVRFGMTKDYGGGFGVLTLRPRTSA